MYDKNSRQATIKELVKAGMVHSQEELQELLNERGFAATQATLSRDMKALGIVKMHDAEFGYSYRMPYASESGKGSVSKTLSSEGITSLEFSTSLAVIKTRPGYANVIGAILDASHLDCVMGTIAGDDTVLLVLREAFTRMEVLDSLSAVLPGIEHMVKQ
jgi:transcriptional regulator of arginine metabolism